ncbi:uncharacterized protein B0T15DRAFT_511969 [Chaetomium strumarium]|uniref:Uncharacterized protein n=1 Tax=Chaetomium strumarium TaxID=1170767 RepID=A0AAJ0M243_9PEZI|nr:hypothetical protein B0T15DRAFT_511969 [Chaetomium strumarium]
MLQFACRVPGCPSVRQDFRIKRKLLFHPTADPYRHRASSPPGVTVWGYGVPGTPYRPTINAPKTRLEGEGDREVPETLPFLPSRPKPGATRARSRILPLPIVVEEDPANNGKQEYGRSITPNDTIQPLALLVHSTAPIVSFHTECGWDLVEQVMYLAVLLTIDIVHLEPGESAPEHIRLLNHGVYGAAIPFSGFVKGLSITKLPELYKNSILYAPK